MVGDYKASLLNAIGNFGIKMPMTSLGQQQPLMSLTAQLLIDITGVNQPFGSDRNGEELSSIAERPLAPIAVIQIMEESRN